MKEPLVEIKEKHTLLNNFFRVIQARLRYRKYDGTMSDEVTRLVFERGNSAAALLYNTETEKLLLVQQFRYPVYTDNYPQGAWLNEIIAGKIDPGETPREAISREILEETGYQVRSLDLISSFYTSPGGSSEKIFFFYGQVISSDKIEDTTGVAKEHEDIKLLEISYTDAMKMLHDHPGTYDAKTLIALQWFELYQHRNYAYKMLHHM